MTQCNMLMIGTFGLFLTIRNTAKNIQIESTSPIPPQKSPSILSRFYTVQRGLPHFTMTNTMSSKAVTSLALQFFLNMVKSNDILG